VVARLGLESAGRAHDCLAPLVNGERPVSDALAGRTLLVDFEAGREALRLTEVVGLDLVTDRAGHTILGERIHRAGVAVERQMREHAALAPGKIGGIAGHRHVTGRALILDRGRGLGILQHLAPNRRLPVRIARRVGHHRWAPVLADRDTATAGTCQAVVAGHAAVAGHEQLVWERRARGR